jgi:hypothetical protein
MMYSPRSSTASNQRTQGSAQPKTPHPTAKTPARVLPRTSGLSITNAYAICSSQTTNTPHHGQNIACTSYNLGALHYTCSSQNTNTTQVRSGMRVVLDPPSCCSKRQLQLERAPHLPPAHVDPLHALRCIRKQHHCRCLIVWLPCKTPGTPRLS